MSSKSKPTCMDCGKELKMKSACICAECMRTKHMPPNLYELLNPKLDKG